MKFKKSVIVGVRFEMFGMSSLFQVFTADGNQYTYTRSELPRRVVSYLEGCKIYKAGTKGSLSVDILLPCFVNGHAWEFDVPNDNSYPNLFDLDEID